MQIEVKHLKKYFDNVKAVDDISFAFSSGQIIGFVGPNGAGKTTTIRILATLEDPTGGDALVDGVSVVQYPEKAHYLLGYVPDSLPTPKDMSVHEYLDFFARAYLLRGDKRRRNVDSIEGFTNLVGIREKPVHSLSKGMKQRVSLARALIQDPPILLMDEPAAGLDPRARIELRELLKVLAGQGKAILISSHILTELAEICTGAIFIEQGKMLAAGSIPELLQAQVTRRTVIIHPLARAQELYKEVVQLPHIDNARLVGDCVEADINGEDEFCCQLLASLIQKGYPIMEFKQQRVSLEEIFMKVTKGEVQ